MKVFVVGGSNSLMSDGWVSKLRRACPDLEIVNLSIGASPSAMAVFRLIRSNELAAGDTLIWEYALNDESQVKRGRIKAKDALRYVEICIRFAASRRASFIPLVLCSQDMRDGAVVTEYGVGLRKLFSHYSIEPIDVNDLWAGETGGRELPADLYQDQQHLIPQSKIMDLVVEACAARLIRVQPFEVLGAPTLGLDLGDVCFLGARQGGREFLFRNSVLETVAYALDSESTCEVQAVSEGSWRVMGAIFLRRRDPAQYALRIDGVRYLIRLFPTGQAFDKVLLSWQPVKTGDALFVGPSTRFSISRESSSNDSSAAEQSQGFVALHLQRVESS